MATKSKKESIHQEYFLALIMVLYYETFKH